MTAPKNSIEVAKPEIFADFLVRWAEESEPNIAALAEACGLPPDTARAVVKRLETKYQPITEVVKRGTTKALLAQMEEKLPMLLDGITQEKINDSALREIAVAFGVIAEKRQLYKGEPTQILTHGERSNINDLIPAIMKEAERRGMTIDAEFHEVPDIKVSLPDDPQIESLSKTAARQASRDKRNQK